MRYHILRHLTLVALLALTFPVGLGDAAAATTFLGPVAVRLSETGEDGKPVPIKHVPVHLNARHADTDASGTAIFDGVPTGRHALKIRLPGYAAIDRDLDLAAGVRQPVDLSLQRAPGASWRGTLRVRVSDRASGQPIAGAAVRIEPVEVKAAIQGPGHAVSDWDGVFEFVDLAPGRYALAATAPGFDDLGGEFRVKPAEEGSREFPNPMVDEVALDVCLNWGAACGKPAADAYCARQGMGLSLAHRVRNDSPPTRVIGSGQKCEASHCDRIEWLRCAGPSEAAEFDTKLRMTPATAPAQAGLKVFDAGTRRPVAKARVTLAEAWPSGEIATGVTDAAGQVNFTALKAGAANWLGADNKVAVARRRVTARVEAEGYAANVFPVSLNETANVILNPTTVQPEAEPNELAAPQNVLTGAPIRFAIERNNDHDTFRFRLVEPAKAVVTIGPNTPLETHLRLRDSQAKLIREQGAHAGQENRIELMLGAGTYFAEVTEWGENANAPDKPMTLTIEAIPATDPNEPNDKAGQAVPVRGGEQFAGLIWPPGDHDFYRIEVSRPGQLRVREPGMAMERHVRVLDRDGKQLQEQGAHPNNPIDFTVQVAPGSHVVEVMEWGNNNASLTPYRLRLDLLPDDGIDDPRPGQGSLRAVRTLAPGGSVHSTLLPRGDIDVYGVALPGAGVLRVQSQGRLERHVQIFDRFGKLLTEQGVHGDQVNDLSWGLAGADTLYVVIREWGDNNDSPSAYRLAAWFEPADEIDLMQRNEDFDHATPMAAGETVRGSYQPRGDRDVYVLEADFPGYLRVKTKSALETHVRVYDAKRKLIAEQGVHGNQVAEIAPAVAAGTYYVMIGEWGDNNSGPVPYELGAVLERAEPGEAWPMTSDAPRRLKDGEAQAYSIDHAGDVDRFVFETARPGTVTVNVVGPIETLIRIYDDQTGKLLHETGHHGPTEARIPLELKNPARLRIELREWGDNNASLASGFVKADTQARPLSAARIATQPRQDDPLRVAFRKQAPERGEAAGRCEIDVNRDGRADLSVSGDQAPEYRFAEAGLFEVESVCHGAAGQTSRQRFWVQTTLPRERTGVALFLPSPAQGQALTEGIDLRAHAMSYDGERIARVDFSLDGRLLASDHEAPYEASPPWQTLAPGEHLLNVVAHDAAGAKAELTRTFTLSEYFGLTPPDGAVLSGDKVRVAWTGQGFGSTEVRYRKKGTEPWQQAVGESGRARSVTLTDLEAGVAYEFQPLGASEGPVRSVTRVKGLAFGEARYGANIRRDYDQKVGISVRNNGDKPLKVRLECGKPKDPLLLVGFVGEGSEDKPIDLGPGEARQFVLGISAQDVTSADHRFPVRIVAEGGLSDEAEVAVHVQLPRVELAWEDKGPAPNGLGRVYRLTNKADAVTDLEVGAADAGRVSISPTVRHGLLQAGQTQDFTVTPQFHEGFTGVDTRIVARTLDKRFEQPYAMQLAPGESARRIWLFPGQDVGAVDPEEERQAIANAEQAQALRPDAVDWSRRDNPEDTDQDGRPDRWSQTVGKVLWIGDDSDNDGTVDFVHADVGDDGVFEYSALLENGRWQATNLVEAWLEMGFALPWSRDSYKPHDAEIVLNGVVIGSLKDSIPEGNYAFRIPPKALKFDASGKPGDNQVGIRSKHLRGGHYVINSDFRFKFRLTATPVWTVAKSEAEARANAGKQSGVSVSAADFSVSSADMRLIGPATPKAGDDMRIEFAVRNLGSASPVGVPVALSRTLPSGVKEELARIVPLAIPTSGPTLLQIPFKARGGANTLAVSIDPDKTFDDLDRANNSGTLFMQVAGDAKPPELNVRAPTDGQTLTDSFVSLEATATDDQGIAGLSVAIDGGLWQDLKSKDGNARRDLLLQPGAHRIDVKAVDFSDNNVVKKLQVQVAAKAPAIRLLAPTAGASVDARSVQVVVELPADAALVAARSAGGPWYGATPEAGQARIELPLDFGSQTIEVMVADRNGTIATTRAQVNCTRQPTEKDEARPPASEHGLIWPADHPGVEIDLFKGTSGLFAPSDPEARARAVAARKEAEARNAKADEARQAREAEALRQREEEARQAEAAREEDARLARELEASLARAEESRRAWEEDARRAREAEAARNAMADEARQAREAEALRQREEEARREEVTRQDEVTRQARAAEDWRIRELEAQLAREREARLAVEDEARRAREETARLQLALEIERTRAILGGRVITTPPENPPAPTTARTPAPWPQAPAIDTRPPQPKTTPLPTPAATARGKLIFEIDNLDPVENGPGKGVKFTLESPQVITLIQHYHWNRGKGAPPGTIALKGRHKRTYGPWQAVGGPGPGGVANAYWKVNPNITLPAGVYSVIDSDPDTWSHNDRSGNRGFIRVEGYPPGAAQSAGGQWAAPEPAPVAGSTLDKVEGAVKKTDETLKKIDKLLDIFK